MQRTHLPALRNAGRHRRATVRTRVTRCALALGALMLGATTIPQAQAQQAQQPTLQFGGSRLVNANWSTISDDQGFQWDFDQYGRIDDGTNNAFNDARALYIQGSHFNSNQQQMTQDRLNYVLVGQNNNMRVTRNIRVFKKLGVVRYIDSFTNQTNSDVNIQVQIRDQLAQQVQQAVTDTGQPASGQLPEEARGVIAAHRQGNHRPGVVMAVSAPRSDVRPSVSDYNQYRFQYDWNVTVPAGKTISIMHGIAQRRNLLSRIGSESQREKLFEPFESYQFTKDIPHELGRTIVNWGSLSRYGDMPGMPDIEGELNVEPRAADVLAMGADSRMVGEATAGGITVTTRFGESELALGEIAAIAGPKYAGPQSKIYLRDGQVLLGDIEASQFAFATRSHEMVNLDISNLDRLVLRAKEGDGATPSSFRYFIQTMDGNRLAITNDSPLPLPLATPWGAIDVSSKNVRWLRHTREQQPGRQVVLSDGSKFFAFMQGGELTLQTALFGEQKLQPTQLRSLVDATLDPESEENQSEAAGPRITLIGDNRIAGRIQMERIHFLAGGHEIPVQPDMIREMRIVDDTMQGGGATFAVTLWDGGTLTGRLRESVLPVNVANAEFHVPASDIREMQLPAPDPPKKVRAEVAQLIRQLGSEDWNQREQATAELVELGPLAHPQLSSTVKQINDPEVKRRIEQVLAEIEE